MQIKLLKPGRLIEKSDRPDSKKFYKTRLLLKILGLAGKDIDKR
jgi:hypothetical protein